MKRSIRAQHFLAIVLVLNALWQSATAGIVVTYDRMREFLENRDAIMIYLNSSNTKEVKYIDFSQNPLQEVLITSQAGGGNPQISPDGTRVAFNDATKSYIAAIEANTTKITEIGTGINPHWWVHPTTKKEHMLIQRGIGANPPGSSADGIYCVEIDASNNPVGTPRMLVNDPMANGGRSADGKYLANNDEEHERCWRGHGLYEIDPPAATSNATIKYWIYVSDNGWYSGGTHAYKAYCNGAMSPSGPGESFYGTMLHMGSAHTEIYVRRPEGYEDDPWVRIQDAPLATCFDTTIFDPSAPLITIRDPKSLGIDGTDNHWGYSDWSTHNDFITGTGGTGTSSSNNKNAYAINIAKNSSDKNYAVKITSGGVAQPDMWVKQGGVRVSLTAPANGASVDVGSAVSLEADATSTNGTIAKVEFFVDGASVGSATSAPYKVSWPAAEGLHAITATATSSAGESMTTLPVSILARATTALAKVEISPAQAFVQPGASVTFAAGAIDQYDLPISPKPAVTWSASGGGTIDNAGKFTAAQGVTGAFTVTASVTFGGVTRAATVPVNVSAFQLKVNFETAATRTPSGYVKDAGAVYGNRGQYTYGWSVDNSANSRERSGSDPLQFRTINHMSRDGVTMWDWEVEVANGNYAVTIAAGDIGYYHAHQISAEGVMIVDGTCTVENKFLENTATVQVSDGRLTLKSAPGAISKICFVEISSVSGPSGVRSTAAPAARSTAAALKAGAANSIVAYCAAEGVYRLNVVDPRGRLVATRGITGGVGAEVSLKSFGAGLYLACLLDPTGRAVAAKRFTVAD